MARTYLPSHVPRLVDLWKKDLARVNPRAADSLADPVSYPNLFPDIDWALKAEELTKYGPLHPRGPLHMGRFPTPFPGHAHVVVSGRGLFPHPRYRVMCGQQLLSSTP